MFATIDGAIEIVVQFFKRGGPIPYHLTPEIGEKINGISIIHNWWRCNNALAFSSTIFLFSKLMNHGLKERRRYDLVLERHQRTKDESKIDRIKLLDFILKKAGLKE